MNERRQTRLPGMEAAESSEMADSTVDHGSQVAKVPPGGAAAAPPTPATAAMPVARSEGPSLEATAPARSLAGVTGLRSGGPPADWTICAVDSHSLIFQVFHAMHGSDLSSPQGEPVGAVYGFVRDMLQLVERRRPTALVCAFDLPGPTFRHRLYDQYKVDRGEMPEELQTQIPKICEILAALGIPVLSSPGYEADDVLATLARLCDETGTRLLVVTGDKDCRQLISDQVSIYNIRKDELYDANSLRDDWGIRPDQVVDFQALVGDKVDNVPGVPLIGPKLAQQLLSDYETLEGVLEHADDVAGAKRRQNLIEHAETARLSRQLVQLDRHTPLEVDWEATRLGGVDAAEVARLFRNLGFRSLGERVSILDPNSGSTFTASASVEGNYEVIDTPQRLAELVEELSGCELISVDVETTDIVARTAEIVGYALAREAQRAYYVPVRGPQGARVLDPVATATALRGLLENPAIGKVGQNLKYDLVALRSAQIHMRGVAFDTMVASYLLDAGERTHNLDDLARRYLNHETIKIGSLIGTGKKQLRMDQVPIDQVGPYAAEDADIPLRLMPLLAERLEAEGLTRLHEEVETPLVELLAELEYRGVAVDVERLAQLQQQYAKRLAELEEEIEKLAGHPFNIGSPKQLAQILFQELELPVVKKTKTGPSTDAGVLEELASLHPLPAKIIEYRQFSKLLSTYIESLPRLVLPQTGRVHASLNQVVAATGRLSSSNPNLQNIPVRTREGREIRSAFTAGEPGWQLLAADYSQVELRVLAHFSQDPALRSAFQRDEDIHRLVASDVHGVALEEVTPQMRRRAKAVNFGVIYGQSSFGLAKSLGIEQQEAADFIEQYFQRYGGVVDFMVQTLTQCRQQGYVTTLLGRRRMIQGVRPVPADLREPKTGALRQLSLPERTAVNTVIQGSAADLIKIAMLRVHRRLEESQSPAKLLLQIHDELLLESPADHLQDLAALVKHEMESAYSLEVPLRVDVKTGPTWAECEPWA
jgi:DNA polymerase-1